MNKAFYDPWLKSRLDRIISLLGREWFENKSILELGACYGDIGKKLVQLGSHLSFSDIRPEFLNFLSKNYPGTSVYKIDQNSFYDLKQSFDLVLHLGVLYHLENWKDDIKNALNHTNLLILESIIYPFIKDVKNVEVDTRKETDPYSSINRKYSLIDEKSLINYLESLNVKYLRIDTPSMTTPFILDAKDEYIKMLYGWDSTNFNFNLEYKQDKKLYTTQPRQMYLILN